MKVAGKVVVVTGAGSGMGRELTRQLLQRGAHVAALDLNDKNLAETTELVKAPPGTLATFTVNVADKATVDALPAQVIEKLGAVDGVINNAGIIQPFVKLAQLEWSAIERVFNVNFWGTLYMTKAFLPHLLARPAAHIMNISSMGGFLPVPGQTIYGASKAAVKLMTEGLHEELADTNVRVTVVFPGAVATNITANSGVEIKMPTGKQASSYKTTSAERAAAIMLDGMEADAYRVLVGSDAKLMDAIYRLDPRRAAGFITKQMKELLK